MKDTPKASTITRSASPESNQRIYEFLKTHPIGVLASVDPNNDPHAAVIYYSVDDDFNLFFTTKRDTKKHDNLKHKDHVMLVAYEASSQTTVQVTGTAEDITDTPEAFEVFKGTVKAALKTSESGVPPISKLYAGNYVAWRINPVQIRMAVFVRPDPGGYDVYETIDFQPRAT